MNPLSSPLLFDATSLTQWAMDELWEVAWNVEGSKSGLTKMCKKINLEVGPQPSQMNFRSSCVFARRERAAFASRQ